MMVSSEAAQLLQWTESHMPLMKDIAKEFEETQPFRGIRIGVSLHLEVKTAVLLFALRRGGADVVAAGNYGTSQDDIVSLLRDNGIDARGSGSDTREEHLATVQSVVESKPDILLDNGADLLKLAIDLDIPVLGATEETTSGHVRLTTELASRVDVPVIVINDSPLKAIVENKHAVGQSVYESFCRLTNLMPQSRSILVIGYGWCGRGIAHYAKANGAHVSVAEVDEIKAMEAAVDGFRVGSVEEMVGGVDVVITATGSQNVVGKSAIARLRDGVLLANAGHFDWEIDLATIDAHTVGRTPLGHTIERHVLDDGRTVDVIARGRMMNLAGPQPKGNSIESMDLGFAMQALSLDRIVHAHGSLPTGAQPVPDDINRELARRFVQAVQASVATEGGARARPDRQA
jgi:adenosylhomocysteinase